MKGNTLRDYRNRRRFVPQLMSDKHAACRHQFIVVWQASAVGFCVHMHGPYYYNNYNKISLNCVKGNTLGDYRNGRRFVPQLMSNRQSMQAPV